MKTSYILIAVTREDAGRNVCFKTERDLGWLNSDIPSDPKDMGAMEYHYNEVARQCGITVPDFKLMDGKYFASKRFDIENGVRHHIATAGALLNGVDYATQTGVQNATSSHRVFNTRPGAGR